MKRPAMTLFLAVTMSQALCSAADSEGAAASSFWLILAGEGTWGAILVAVVGVLWKFAKPYLDEWAERRKLDKLLLAVETGVGGCKALYTDELKKANADGKLTADEVAYIRRKCREYIVSFMAAQGVDALKEYGPVVIDMLCEWMLDRIKLPSAVKAVAAPLSASVSPPIPELEPATPAVTAAAFG
ncbi:MAG: hypothetical protein LIP77_00350 [Planctomycetes bacterium]|nr:hypothetical protein [Planctomycetota bacterium]